MKLIRIRHSYFEGNDVQAEFPLAMVSLWPEDLQSMARFLSHVIIILTRETRPQHQTILIK